MLLKPGYFNVIGLDFRRKDKIIEKLIFIEIDG